ncbi:MAG: hypothetical protein EPN72_06015 [Nevskiaceae bacterium]|nr:MAG: hypothetical protein EPN63_03180 [Nevskiaceae bacterium]TBR73688.1 MAG: hypothetical protein EPN72_06015 [Nevskiaceae bacterium]
MRRREVLAAIGASALAACRSPDLRGVALQFKLPEPPRVRIETAHLLQPLDASMLGLALESSALVDPAFISVENHGLVDRLRALNRGVLCVGGHSADMTLWQLAGGAAVPKPYRYALDEAAVKRLAGFVEAVGSTLVFGIGLAHDDPARATREARAVLQHAGSRLAAFQFGHAPDLYVDNRWRPSGFDAQAYAQEWATFAQAVRAGVPKVPFVGPEAIGPQRQRWVSEFVARCGDQVGAVTVGEYQQAPRTEDYDRRRRAAASQAVPDGTGASVDLRSIVAAARTRGLPAWITQAAWLERGDPADTLEAALWAIQTFYSGHEQGVARICFDLEKPGAAGPMYHGLKLVAQTFGGRRVATTASVSAQDAKDPTKMKVPDNLHAWAVLDARERVQLVLVNRDRGHSTDVRIAADRKLAGGTILRLTGPGYDARDQVTFAGATVDVAGRWQPQYTEAVQWVNGTGWLTLGAASAALVLFE